MEIEVNEKIKSVSIYMTNADQHDPACEEQLKSLTQEWHSKGWLPVVYYSGKDNLEDLTSALLVSNRNRAARREVETARKLRTAP